MDGNCWYHSIREATLGNGLDFDGYVDHVELRVAVVNFVNSGRDMDFVKRWVIQNPTKVLDREIINQYANGEYVHELFICATALLLQVAILVTRSNSTPQFPYEIFWPYDHVPENRALNRRKKIRTL